MKSTQNNSFALAQGNQIIETSCPDLRDDLAMLIRSLQARANTFNKKRRTRNNQMHWMVRGRQQALQRVSAQLDALRAASLSSYTLYLALQEYLVCLDKYCLDVEEERHARRPRNGLPIEPWKAEGEALELPRITRALFRIVQAHTPDPVRHTLSLDGKTLVPLYDENERCEPESVSSSHAPTLGPFPIIPDEVDEAQQARLLTLEEVLSHHAQVFVDTECEGVDTVSLLLMFLDRVLQYTPIERILVLTGSEHQLTHLYQRYKTWVSLEDGVPLSECYTAQYHPAISGASESQICFSGIHEMHQMAQSVCEQEIMRYRQTYDMIILVTDRASYLAPWQQVLAFFDAPYRVGFGASSDPLIAWLFDVHVVTSEARFQASESDLLDHSAEESSDEAGPCKQMKSILY